MKSKKHYCTTDVELEAYDGEEISYYFELEDKVSNIAIGKNYFLTVDTTDPVLNNPGNFWSQGTGRYSRYIYFNFSITEENFETINYIDYAEGSRARWKKVCNRLDSDGICEAKKAFRRGHHMLDIQITDKAGNAVSTERVEFDVL